MTTGQLLCAELLGEIALASASTLLFRWLGRWLRGRAINRLHPPRAPKPTIGHTPFNCLACQGAQQAFDARFTEITHGIEVGES